jgi:hypothetical protein
VCGEGLRRSGSMLWLCLGCKRTYQVVGVGGSYYLKLRSDLSPDLEGV